MNIDIFADSIKFGGGRTLSTQARSPLWDIAPFAAADLVIGKVTLSAGARYDYVRIPFEDALDPSLDTVGVYKRLNPRIGASVEVHPGRVGLRFLGSGLPRPRGDRERLRGSQHLPVHCPSRSATTRRSRRSRRARSRPASDMPGIAIPCPVRRTTPT